MLIFSACLAIFIYGMVASMLGTIIPGLAHQFALTNVQVGYVALAQGIGLAAASLAVGALIDRRGKKVGLLLGLGLILAGSLQLAYPHGLMQIIAGTFILGMGGSMVIVGANALASDVDSGRRASVLNFLNVFVGLGGLATPFIAGNLLSSDPTRVAIGACSITAVAFVIVACTRMPFQPVTHQESAAATSAVFRNGTLYILAAIIFLYTACEFGVWNWLPKYLIAKGMSSSTALTILSLGFALGLLFGRMVAARILTNFSPFVVTLCAAAVMALTTLCMLNTSGPALTAMVVFCAGLSMAPIFPTVISIVGDIFTRATSTAIGFVITCGFSGLIVSSPLIGWLSGSGTHGLGRGLLLLPSFSAVILVFLVVFRSRLVSQSHVGSAVEAGII
jgi:fucose permease